MKTINILGAGLSGLTAAINLAKAGYTVNVYETRNDCGQRFHGDLQGLENWSSHKDIISEIQSMNININFDCDPMNTMFLSNGEETIPVTSPKPIFYLVKRGEMKTSFDQGLKTQAIELGVNIYFNSKTPEEKIDIISIGPSTRKITAMAKGIVFETGMDDIAVALVNKKTSYNGYSYLLVSKGYGCICTVSAYQFVDIDTYLKNTCEIFHSLYDLQIKNQKNTGGVGSFLLRQRLRHNHRLYTGEAAGLQDCLWGFGMRYAFTSGYLAAQSIIEGKNYKTLIKKTLSDKIKASIVNRFYTEYVDDYGNILMAMAKKQKQGEHINLLFKSYNLSLYGRVVYPYAKLYLRRKFKDLL